MKIRYIKAIISRNIFLMLSFIAFISIGYSVYNGTIYISGKVTSGAFVTGNKLLIDTLSLNPPRYTSGVSPVGYIYQEDSMLENNLYTYYKINEPTKPDKYSSTQMITFKLKNTYSLALRNGSIVVQNQQNTSFLNVTGITCNVTNNTDFVCPSGYTCTKCYSTQYCPAINPCAAGYICSVNDTFKCPEGYKCRKCLDDEICPAIAPCIHGYVCEPNPSGSFTCPEGYICHQCDYSEDCPATPPCIEGYYCRYDGPDSICSINDCLYCQGEPYCPTEEGLCSSGYMCLSGGAGWCVKCYEDDYCFADEEGLCPSGYYFMRIIDPLSSKKHLLYDTLKLSNSFDSTHLFYPVNKNVINEATAMSVSDIVYPNDDIICNATYYTNPYNHTTGVGNIQSTIKLTYLVGGETQSYYYNIVLVP